MRFRHFGCLVTAHGLRTVRREGHRTRMTHTVRGAACTVHGGWLRAVRARRRRSSRRQQRVTKGPSLGNAWGVSGRRHSGACVDAPSRLKNQTESATKYSEIGCLANPSHVPSHAQCISRSANDLTSRSQIFDDREIGQFVGWRPFPAGRCGNLRCGLVARVPPSDDHGQFRPTNSSIPTPAS